MAQKQIKQFTEETAPVAGDMYLMQKASNDETVKVDAENMIPDGSVTTPKIAEGAVTPSKIAVVVSSATIGTSQTTSTTSFTDLSTVGPSVTVNVSSNGILLIDLFARHGAASSAALMSFELSGANTLSADDNRSIATFNSGDEQQCGGRFYLSGLNAGSTTITAKYRRGASGSGSASFSRRTITVTPI